MSDEKPETDPNAPRPTARKPSELTKDSDRAIRPGFRNPPNARSKASKGSKGSK
jgi:hypothetical protein